MGDTRDSAGAKNTLAFREAIATLQQQQFSLEERVTKLTALLGDAARRLDALEQGARVVQAAAFGRGPSVKP